MPPLNEAVVESVDDCPESIVDGTVEMVGPVRDPLTVHDRRTLVESAAATLVLMLRLAVRVPEADGVHVNRTVQLVPAAMPAIAVEQLSDETLKSAAFVPLMLGTWTTSGPVPVFVTVTF